MDFPGQCSGEIGRGSLPYVYSNRPPKIPNKAALSDDNGVNTVELIFNDGSSRDHDGIPSETKNFPCSVPCKFNNNFSFLNAIRIQNTNWEIIHTMEGERIYPEAQVRPFAYRKNQFYATTSLKSEIPLPYFSWSEYKIQHAAVDFQKAIKGASFLANNCESHNKRETVVEELMKTRLRVDSLSGCLNNANPLPGVDMNNKTAIMEQYLFYLAFENQEVDDYITEKLWGALAAGTLPVYLGAKNVKEHIPINSVIVAEDFRSPQDLADYLIRLTTNRELYESYHAWRYQTIDDAFVKKYEFTKTHSTCRICKWTFAKRHGLGWNHSKQTILKPYIDHKTCRNEKGLIGYPFKEYWLVSNLSNSFSKAGKSEVHVFSTNETRSCTLNEENRVIEIDYGAIRRKVYDRDGVTDLIIDFTTGRGQSSKYVDYYILRLATSIKVGDADQQLYVVNDFAWWLQDHQSRFYVMASGDSSIRLSIHEPGIIEIIIPSPPKTSTAVFTSTVRVRVVTEDRDHFHQKTKKIPSYFGDLMMRDFFEPVASYQIRN